MSKLTTVFKSFRRKRRILVAFGMLLLLVGLGLQYYWLDGLWGAAWELTIGKTEFAPRYSEFKFRRVDVGMTNTQVKALIGPPLRIASTTDPGEEVWFYTNPKVWDKNKIGGNCHYTVRNVILSNGAVTRKRHEFYFD